MIDRVKPRQKVELPTEGPDDHILEQIKHRFRVQREAPGTLESGLRQSSTGILTGQGFSLENQQLRQEYQENNPNWVRDGIENLINMGASLPAFAAGSAVGGALGGPLGSGFGGFALDTAIKTYYQKYLEAIQSGETSLSFEDWAEVAKEAGTSGALGAGLNAVSPWIKLATANKSVAKVLRTPLTKEIADQILEAGAFTVGGAAVGHGDLSLESFRDNLIAIAGFRLADGTVKRLYTEYKKTRKPPEQLLLEYNPTPDVIAPEPTPEQIRRAKVRSGAHEIPEEDLFKSPRRSNEPVKMPPKDYGFAEGFGEGLERLSELEAANRARRAQPALLEFNPRDVIVPEATPEQLRRAKEKARKGKPVSKRAEDELFRDLPEKEAERRKIKAREESERAELKRIEDGIRELEAKEKEQKKAVSEREQEEINKRNQSFIDDLSKDIEERMKLLKKKRNDLKAQEQAALYKKAVELKKRVEEQENRERIAKKEMAEKTRDRVASFKERSLDLRKKIASLEPSPRERFETEREMNKPLSQRLSESIAAKEAEINSLNKEIMHHYQKKTPRAIREKVEKRVEAEKEILNELKTANEKRSPKTIQESSEEIVKTKGNKDYVKRTQKAADKMAEALLKTLEKSDERPKLIEGLKKDLEKMGINLRCL